MNATDPIDLSLLPACSGIDPTGALSISGATAAEIATEWGTPTLVYDLDEIRRSFAHALEVFGPGTAYATKAFLSHAIVDIANDEGISLDASTDGEYEFIRAAGFPADRIVVHGNNKSDYLLERSIYDRVQWLVIDSEDEFHRVAELCEELALPCRVMLRVNPGIEVHTHEYVATGNRHSKFGVPAWNDEAVQLMKRIQEHPLTELQGLHTHIGSQIFCLDNFARAIESLAHIVSLSSASTLVVGGGLGVRYTNGDRVPTLTEWASTLNRLAAAIDFDGRILTEPGRVLVASAALTIYRVGSVRTVSNNLIAAVDGGMSDNPRPVLYDSAYEAFLADGVDRSRSVAARIVGSHCESGDVIVGDGSLQREPTRGDLLVTPVTGAYGYSMSSNYNRTPRPAVVYAESGKLRLGIERESFAHLRAMDTGFRSG